MLPVDSIIDAGKLKQNAAQAFLNVEAILECLDKVKDIPCFTEFSTSEKGIK